MKKIRYTNHGIKHLVLLFTIMFFIGCDQDDDHAATAVTFKLTFQRPNSTVAAEASDVCVDYQVSEISVYIYRTRDGAPIAEEVGIPCEDHHLMISNVPAEESLYIECTAMSESSGLWEGGMEEVVLSSHQTNDIGEVIMSFMGDGLIGHWTFDENPNDVINNYHATLFNGGVYVDNGKIRQALQLDGIDDYADTALIERDFTDFSLSAWVKLPEIGSDWSVLMEYDREGDYWFALSKKEDRFRFLLGGIGQEIDSRRITSNRWYHIVCSYMSGDSGENGTASIYIDGDLHNSEDGFSRLNSEPNPNRGVGPGPYLRIGNNQEDEPGQAVHAIIDDVRLYEVALSNNEVNNLYKSVQNSDR